MKQQPPLISIVMPAYNAQHSIVASLDSVSKQTFAMFEFIIVNDGSTDGTGDILEKYTERDARIKLLQISNHGVNYARKLGVQHAKGTFVAFLDADDQLHENALEMYLEHIEDHDILLANCFADKVIGKAEYLSLMMDELLPKELWGKFFKRSLLTDEIMTLPHSIGMGEDYIWNIRVTKYINSAKLIRANYYSYDNQNATSAIHNFKKSVAYERLFLQTVFYSLLYLGKREYQAKDLLTVQRFNIFVGLVQTPGVDVKDPFVKKMGRTSKVLRKKRNILLYSIMRLPVFWLKVIFVRLYFRVM